MVSKDRTTKSSKDIKDEDVEEFKEVFGELQKVVVKAGLGVRK